MKHIFHPIIGDHQHGDGHHNRMLTEYAGLQRLMLHALSIEFCHPATGELLSFEAPFPDSFLSVLQRVGLDTLSGQGQQKPQAAAE